MSIAESDAELQKQQFIIQSVTQGKVWGLHCEQGWSNADSCDLEDTVVYPFWSTEELAQLCAVDEWSVYAPKYLDLSEFLENWCVGMYKEYILAGIDWNPKLEGAEVDSIDLALKLVQELKKQKKEVKLKLYKNLADFEKMLLEVIEEERKSLN
ncbi:MAG: DUF2750 domain-containing protein [Opitutaceae bacterium]|nr:DUF2750 domain-containing protein [Cytophagales bacterium]